MVKNFTSDTRIRIIKQKNEGVSSARNRGISSKYNYIAFLDGDDDCLSGYLEKMKAAIELFPNADMYGSSSWHRNIFTGKTRYSILNI